MDPDCTFADFTWSGGSATYVDDLRRTAKLLRTSASAALGHGPPVADRARRPAGARHARGVHHPRLPGRRHRAGRAPRLGDRRHLPRPRHAGQGRHHAGRALRRPRLAGHRRRLERGGGASASGCRSRASPSGSSGSRRPCRSACRCGRRRRRPYEGKHYQLGRTLNAPQSLQRPHPPILIGGGGEKKTLRLVAQYADACNLFAAPTCAHKLDVLREHCDDPRPRLRRDREDRHGSRLDPGADGEHVDAVLSSCASWPRSA